MRLTKNSARSDDDFDDSNRCCNDGALSYRQERKRVLSENADCIITLPGGLGTWDELWEAVCLKGVGETAFFFVPPCLSPARPVLRFLSSVLSHVVALLFSLFLLYFFAVGKELKRGGHGTNLSARFSRQSGSLSPTGALSSRNFNLLRPSVVFLFLCFSQQNLSESC